MSAPETFLPVSAVSHLLNDLLSLPIAIRFAMVFTLQKGNGAITDIFKAFTDSNVNTTF